MRFMLTVQLVVPPERAEQARALAPAENAYVAEQLKLGILEAIYYEAVMPPDHIWAVMRADSLEAAQRLVEDYPMYEYFRLTYTPLR